MVLIGAAGAVAGVGVDVDGLAIVGASDCPSADAVRSRFVELAAAPATAGRAGRGGQARISLLDGLLDVSLRSGAGTLVGQKAVVAPVRCDDRADVAAALLVAWSAEQGPEVSLPYPEPRGEVAGASSAAPVIIASLASSAPPRPSSGWRGSLAISFCALASLQGDPVVPAVSLEGAIGRSRSWLEGLASAGLAGERTVPLGTGTASWRTARLRLGATARLFGRDDSWQVGLAAGAGLVWVDAQGHGFATSQGAGSIAPESWAGLRLALPVWGPLRLFAAGQVARRLQRQQLATDNPVSIHELPRAELELTVGASVSFPTRRTEGL
jgi:hypothetical protein